MPPTCPQPEPTPPLDLGHLDTNQAASGQITLNRSDLVLLNDSILRTEQRGRAALAAIIPITQYGVQIEADVEI